MPRARRRRVAPGGAARRRRVVIGATPSQSGHDTPRAGRGDGVS
ncbi:hypothetical protein R0J90_06095 [Micrococcus sp. SIMBA_144]